MLLFQKYLLFEDDNKFNNYKAKYQNIQINIVYLDYINQYLKLDKINSIIESNNKNSSVQFTLNKIELKTINLLSLTASKLLKLYSKAYLSNKAITSSGLIK